MGKEKKKKKQLLFLHMVLLREDMAISKFLGVLILAHFYIVTVEVLCIYLSVQQV